MERLGIFGGTFDPIHHGHLAIAEAARQELALERVLFVPAAQQPLKQRHAAPAAERLELVRLATAGNPAFAVSTLELERPGPSYTADTLAAIRAAHPGAALWFIIGADATRWLPQWHRLDRVVAEARLGVIARPGYELDLDALAAGQPLLAGRMDLLAAPRLDISATELRERIAAGRSIRYLVPDSVAARIAAAGLYQSRPNDQGPREGASQ